MPEGTGFVSATGGVVFNLVHIFALATILSALGGLIGAQIASIIVGVLFALIGAAYLNRVDFDDLNVIGVGFALTGAAAVLQALKLVVGMEFIDPVLVAVVAIVAFLLKYAKSAPEVGKYIPD